MKQLVDGTGLHRQTIHSYLRAGILPAPDARRTGHARYDARHLELLGLLRELHSERGLSLEAIGRSFAKAGFDAAEVRRSLPFGGQPLLQSALPSSAIAASELVRRAGASETLFQELRGAGALSSEPDAPDELYGAEALTILTAAKRLVEQGVSVEALRRLLHHAEGVAGVEVGVLASDASGLSGDGEPLAVRAERRHADIGELFSAVRRASLRGVLRRLVEVGPRARRFAEDAIYIPSPLFIRRHQLEQALAEAEARAETGEAEATRSLGRLLLGLGRYAEAVLAFSRSTLRAPDDAEAHAYLGLARSTAGAIGPGVESCERAVALAPRSPRAHAFLGATLALEAAMSVGLTNPGEQLRHAFHVAGRSRAFDPSDERERMEVLLARGRLFTVLPAGMPGRSDGIADLEAVLSMTAPGQTDRAPEIPGTSALHRVHALYYLGVCALDDGRAEQARAWLGECVTIDPASRFAELAYDLLGSLPL